MLSVRKKQFTETSVPCRATFNIDKNFTWLCAREITFYAFLPVLGIISCIRDSFPNLINGLIRLQPLPSPKFNYDEPHSYVNTVGLP